ncbi:Epoxyqueuosine reductase [uncultured Gammaproteobacteria bacterium]
MSESEALETIREQIRNQALTEGFDAVGFARAEAPGTAAADLAEYLAQGLHGDMGWMAETAARRGSPQALWPQARTVIALGLSYAPPRLPPLPPERGQISVYARGRDYHDVVKKKLKALAGWLYRSFGHEVKVFVDTAPVMEKPLAVAAGIGWQGKHTNVVSRHHGSWLFLGEIFTTLDLPTDSPHQDLCGRCRRCLDACPTAAFIAPHRLDARRCLSYLTIEHKGPLPEEFRVAMGNRIYGCDACMAACPWNRFARTARDSALWPRAELTAPRLIDLARLKEADFRTLFAGSPVKRVGRDRFVHLVLIALANSGDQAGIEVAREHLEDPSPLIREAARWAAAQSCKQP